MQMDGKVLFVANTDTLHVPQTGVSLITKYVIDLIDIMSATDWMIVVLFYTMTRNLHLVRSELRVISSSLIVLISNSFIYMKSVQVKNHLRKPVNNDKSIQMH